MAPVVGRSTPAEVAGGLVPLALELLAPVDERDASGRQERPEQDEPESVTRGVGHRDPVVVIAGRRRFRVLGDGGTREQADRRDGGAEGEGELPRCVHDDIVAPVTPAYSIRRPRGMDAGARARTYAGGTAGALVPVAVRVFLERRSGGHMEHLAGCVVVPCTAGAAHLRQPVTPKVAVSTGIGETLREAREAQGRSLEDAAQAVRARTSQLQDLEDERFDAFGGEVYAKGFLRSYAVALGLDPEPLVATYRREVGQKVPSPSSNMVVPVKTGGAPRSTTPPAWAAWALVAVLVVAGIVFLGIISSPAPDTAGDDPPVGTPPASAPSAEDEDEVDGPDTGDGNDDTSEPDPEPDPDPEPEPEPEVEFEGVEVVLALEAASWMRVTQDGAVILEEVVDAGETRQYVAESELIIRLGNAGGVRVQYNGEDIGSAGGSGEVVELRFTPDGFEPI